MAVICVQWNLHVTYPFERERRIDSPLIWWSNTVLRMIQGYVCIHGHIPPLMLSWADLQWVVSRNMGFKATAEMMASLWLALNLISPRQLGFCVQDLEVSISGVIAEILQGAISSSREFGGMQFINRTGCNWEGLADVARTADSWCCFAWGRKANWDKLGCGYYCY